MLRAHLDLDHPLYWTVTGVLSPVECDAMIARIEAADRAGEAELASINTAAGPVVRTDIRNNTRVIFDDHKIAVALFERVRSHLPETLLGWKVSGANERLRCYRYHPGERFGPHYDGSFQRSDNERSLLTFMVYLNDGFEGGGTTFLDLDEVVEPAPGMALLFQHPILHEGSEVTSGIKYVVRSDIMYRAP
jgi:predicted 2-oxoglutarate/Fe(II)-dependent dioxygenase YbiX